MVRPPLYFYRSTEHTLRTATSLELSTRLLIVTLLKDNMHMNTKLICIFNIMIILCTYISYWSVLSIIMGSEHSSNVSVATLKKKR